MTTRKPMKGRRTPGVGAPPYGGAHGAFRVHERAAAHDEERVVREVARVVGLVVGVGLVRAAGELPDVAAHVAQAEGALGAVEAAGRG